jgi:hypothetical protein
MNKDSIHPNFEIEIIRLSPGIGKSIIAWERIKRGNEKSALNSVVFRM